MSAFLPYSSEQKGGDRLNVLNGTVAPAYTQPEFRDGLRFLSKLYKEGLLDPQAFVQDQAQLKQLVEGGDAPRLGSVTAGWQGNWADITAKRIEQYYLMGPLKGPKGVQTSGFYPSGFNWDDTYTITKDCQYPEVAFKWGDYLYSWEATQNGHTGQYGVNWTDAQPGELDSDGKQAAWKVIVWPWDMGPEQNVYWGHTAPGYAAITTPTAVSQPWPRWHDVPRSALYYPYVPKEVLPPVIPFTAEESKQLPEMKTLITGYVNENIARFITGDRSLDTEWDSYLAEFKKMNLDALVSLYQKAYDRVK